MTKIIITDAVDEKHVNRLKSMAGFEVDFRNGINSKELSEIVGNYECIVVRSRTKLTHELISKAERAKLIVRAGVGTDNIDVEAASTFGIPVANTPWANVVSAAELAFAFMLALSRRVHLANSSMHEGKWETLKFTGSELSGKTLGIIGLGRVGREVARRARAFQMEIVATDPFIGRDVAEAAGVHLVSKEKLLAEADIVTLHASMMPGNVHLIGMKEMELMKKNSLLINTARGEMVDSGALVHFIKEGKIAGAGLDVFEKEQTVDPRLAELPNVVMTPHIGAQTREAQNRVGGEVVEVIETFFNRGEMMNVVNAGRIEKLRQK